MPKPFKASDLVVLMNSMVLQTVRADADVS